MRPKQAREHLKATTAAHTPLPRLWDRCNQRAASSAWRAPQPASVSAQSSNQPVKPPRSRPPPPSELPAAPRDAQPISPQHSPPPQPSSTLRHSPALLDAAAGVHSSSAAVSAQQLTLLIATCPSLDALQALCDAHGPRMNFIHAAALLTRLAKVLPAAQLDTRSAPGRGAAGRRPACRGVSAAAAACVSSVCRLALPQLPQFQPRAVANSLWAVAKLLDGLPRLQPSTGPPPPGAPPPGAPPLGAPPLEAPPLGAPPLEAPPPGSSSSGAFQPVDPPWAGAARFEAQHLASAAYALALAAAALRPGSSSDRQQGRGLAGQGGGEGQEGAAAVEGGAAGGGVVVAPGEGGLAAGEGDTRAALRAGLQQLLATCPPPRLGEMSPQGLANLLYAVACLDLAPDPDWLAGWLDAAEPLLPAFAPQHLANALWALAAIAFFPGDEWLDLALGSACLQLPAFSPQGLTTLLASLAHLAALPAAPHTGQLLDALALNAPRCNGQDTASALWALARLQQQGALGGPTETRGQAGAGGGEGSRLKLQAGPGSGQAEEGVPSTDSLPPPVGPPTEVRAAVLSLLRAFHISELALSLWSLAALRLPPPAPWLNAWWEASRGALAAVGRGGGGQGGGGQAGRGQEVAVLLVAVAQLELGPCAPPGWWEALEAAWLQQLPRQGPRQLANCCWALARLRRPPGPALQTALLAKLPPQLRGCGGWLLAVELSLVQGTARGQPAAYAWQGRPGGAGGPGGQRASVGEACLLDSLLQGLVVRLSGGGRGGCTGAGGEGVGVSSGSCREVVLALWALARLSHWWRPQQHLVAALCSQGAAQERPTPHQ
ncbi:hypothetical protein V8C86DRAFT_3033362 [Haematococcus lacustris]